MRVLVVIVSVVLLAMFLLTEPGSLIVNLVYEKF